MRSASFLRAAEAVAGMSPTELAIIRSVLYAALFDYPLTLAQLRQSLTECALTPCEIQATYAGSAVLQQTIEQRAGFFFPRGRGELIEERRKREAYSRQFLDQHRLFLALAGAIPYVDMLALSGSVAHRNLEPSGDLDLFIVTRGRHVWSVTVAVVLLAKMLRRRQAVCANFVVADTALTLDQQDLFTASQIIHLKPLTGGTTYRRFLAANPFVARFYPNFRAPLLNERRQRPATRLAKRAVELAMALPAVLAETLCRTAYRAYLNRRRGQWESPNQVRLAADCLKLHTRSHRASVLARFDHAVDDITNS